jgi:hypothetical protein
MTSYQLTIINEKRPACAARAQNVVPLQAGKAFDLLTQ